MIFFCVGIVGTLALIVVVSAFFYVAIEIDFEDTPSLRAYIRAYRERCFEIWQWLTSANEPKRKRKDATAPADASEVAP